MSNNYRGNNQGKNKTYRQPLNAPEYFTRQINRCKDQLFELRRLSRQRDVTLDFLYQRLNTCGAFYQQLLEVANRDNITWKYYKYQHENIGMCLAHIQENLELKSYQRQIQQASEVPSWLRSLAGLAEIADNAMGLVGLPPLAGKAYKVFAGIYGFFTGKNYLQLGGGATKYLPPPR